MLAILTPTKTSVKVNVYPKINVYACVMVCQYATYQTIFTALLIMDLPNVDVLFQTCLCRLTHAHDFDAVLEKPND